MNTNSQAITAAETLAQGAGYNLSAGEISAFMALAGGVVHVLHQIVNAGGIKPVMQMLWDNKPATPEAAQPKA